jgi:hypothetical protein
MKIPATLHRIWLGRNPLPAEFQEFGRTWERLHPGWESRLWTDENLPPLVNQTAFENAPSFAAKADILRYEILLRHGGVYVDTDFECLRSLETLLAEVDCFVAQQRDLDSDFGRFCYVNNALMGAVPEHPLFQDLVGLLGQHMKGLPADVPASYLTGPHYLTTVLQAHPGVRIFPAALFYPYTATERWRRHEKFPDAYAVHHWTLSDVAVSRLKSRTLGDGESPCLSVSLHPAENHDPLRLRWVLEGLCLQTVTNFEVLLPVVDARGELAALGREYQGRLKLRLLEAADQATGAHGSSAGWRNLALAAARAPRVLYLDSDSLPDPDVVELHARYGDKPRLVFGFRRIYPVGKLFPYRDAVDYSGLIPHCVPEQAGLYLVPSAERWREVVSGCCSVPAALVFTGGGFAEATGEDEVRALAGQLAASGCPTVPCLYGGRVTQLGPPAATVASGRPLAMTTFRFNQTIASLSTRTKSNRPVRPGRSPYALRVGTLRGPVDRNLTALTWHLLKEFETARVPAEAIANVGRRVAIDPGKAQRVASLCAGYINEYLSLGVLVPAFAEADTPDAAANLADQVETAPPAQMLS